MRQACIDTLKRSIGNFDSLLMSEQNDLIKDCAQRAADLMAVLAGSTEGRWRNGLDDNHNRDLALRLLELQVEFLEIAKW